MKYKHLMPLALIGLMAASGFATAQDRIDLSVGNFRPLEAETSKFLTPIQRKPVAGQQTDLTAEDRSYLSPEELGEIRKMEVYQKIQERMSDIAAAEAQDEQREQETERLRQAMLGQPEMRPLFEGGKKLAARLSQYDIFRILERNDMAELLQEAGSQGADKTAAVFAAGRLASSYKVYVDVGDLQRNTYKGKVGGVAFEDRTFVRDYILKLQSVTDGSIALSQTFKIQKKQTVTDVGKKVSETVHEEMVDDAVEQIAEAIYNKFMVTLKFSMKVAPNNPNLDPSMIALSILNANGEEVGTAQDGVEVAMRKGKYTLQCQDPNSYLFSSGKDKMGPMDFSAPKTVVQTFQSAMQEVEFTFNDPDGNFPMVTLTPNGWEGETVYATAGLNQVRKGNYKMSATLEGYKDIVDKPVMVSSATKTVPIQMMKIPVATPAVQPVQ